MFSVVARKAVTEMSVKMRLAVMIKRSKREKMLGESVEFAVLVVLLVDLAEGRRLAERARRNLVRVSKARVS